MKKIIPPCFSTLPVMTLTIYDNSYNHILVQNLLDPFHAFGLPEYNSRNKFTQRDMIALQEFINKQNAEEELIECLCCSFDN